MASRNMMVTKRFFHAIITFTFILQSCVEHENARTIYWSGNSFYLGKDLDTGSTQKWLFYMGYYIEVSDTGDTKLMTRKKFNAKPQYYLISLEDSVKNEILKLSADKSLYYINQQEQSDNYSGFSYSLKFKSNTIERTTSFIPTIATPVQKKLYLIFDEIWKSPKIIRQTIFDTREYERSTELELIKSSPLPPLPRREQVKFPPEMTK